MNRHFVTLVKLTLVGLLMWFVFHSIHFEDRLVYRSDQQVVAEDVISIEGHWEADPVHYTYVDAKTPEQRGTFTASRGEQIDGRTLDVEPGFLSYWRHLDPILFALGGLCYCLTVMIAGARWWWLLRVNGTGVSLFETLRFTWIGVFFNTVVPGATGGDVIKALYIMKRCPGHRVQVLVSVGVDRILGLGSLALLGAIAVLFALDEFADIALGIWAVIFLVGALGVIAFSRRLRSMVKLKWLLNHLPNGIRTKLQMVDKAIFFYRNQRMVLIGSLIAGIFNHVLSVCCVILIGEAIGVGMPTYEYFVLVPIINIISALPIGPNGWGVGEALYGHLFGTHGAAFLPATYADPVAAMKTRGVALSVLYRLVLTFFSLLAGLLVLFEKDRVTQEDIDREQALEDSDAKNPG